MNEISPAKSPENVTLRPVEEADLDLLAGWRTDPDHESPYGDFLIHRRRRSNARELWELNGLLSEDDGRLMICLEGVPVGSISWHSVSYGPNKASQAINFGIGIAAATRGRGVGTRAQRLLADFLFAHTAVHRVEASTDVTNLAEQTALTRAGYRRDGVLRGAQFRLGEWHDMVLYSRLRADI